MTREEAISRLHWYALDNCDKARIDEAIEALSATSQNLAKPNNADDLISRADAMGEVQDHFNANGFKGYDDGQKMMDRINALPSAEAVQVVRCKGCRHRYEEGDCTHYYWCRLHDRPVDDTDYCALGEESEVKE